MSRPFFFHSVVFVTILGLYGGNLSGVVRADDGLVRVPLQKSQDVSSKIDNVGPDMKTEIDSSTLAPLNAFKDQISIIEGQLNTGLDALSKSAVDKDKATDAKRDSVPLEIKPVPLDAVQGQIGILQGQITTGENTERQVQNAVVQNTNKTTPAKLGGGEPDKGVLTSNDPIKGIINVGIPVTQDGQKPINTQGGSQQKVSQNIQQTMNSQDGAQAVQQGVQQSINAEANTQDRMQPKTAQQASSTQNSQKSEFVDLDGFVESPDQYDPEMTDYSSELSTEITSIVYPFTQTIGAASGENDKMDMSDTMHDEDEDDFPDNNDDDDDVHSSKEKTKTKWFDDMMEDEEEEKKEKEDEEENEDYINYEDEDQKITSTTEEDSPGRSTMGATVGIGKLKIKESFVANRPFIEDAAEESMVSFYTWILLVTIIAVFAFFLFKNRHKVQGYILHFSRRRSNGSKLNGDEARKLMAHEYA